MAKHKDTPENETYVGYKNPPKHTQFKPGQSGNPKGRPKKSKNLKTEILELMDQTIIIHEGGKPKQVTGRQALLMALFAKAVKGNVAAAEKLLKLVKGFEGPYEAEDELDRNDLDILKRYVEGASK